MRWLKRVLKEVVEVVEEGLDCVMFKEGKIVLKEGV